MEKKTRSRTFIFDINFTKNGLRKEWKTKVTYIIDLNVDAKTV